MDFQGSAGGYEWISYAEMGDIRTAIGSGLSQIGVTARSTIGIYSVNCIGTFNIETRFCCRKSLRDDTMQLLWFFSIVRATHH